MFVTVSIPVVDVALQFTVNETVVVCPACTVALCGLGLVTVQFAGTADSVTVYVPAGASVSDTLPLGASGALSVPAGPLAVTV
ncbi:MAG TPA: hypothetical protein VGV12_08580 [Gemmatimonadales bacterium]|nr:hypothetical protein [Gemmatimonadales bacterium]